MNQNIFNSLNNEAVQAALQLLGGAERALMLLDAGGYVLWQTPAAQRLLRLDWGEPVMSVLSEKTARAVAEAVRHGARFELDEVIDDVLYRLRSQPVQGGLLVYAVPCGEENPGPKTESVRSLQETQVLGHMMHTVQKGLEHARDENDRARWEHMAKMTRRARCIHLYDEIISGAPCLDERVTAFDLAAVCRETAEEAAEQIGIPIEVPAGELPGVLSREAFQFVLLGLLVNAAAKQPEHIAVALRRTGGHLCLQVSDDASVLSAGQIGELLGSWRGSAAGTDRRDLAKMGLGLPAVQRLLGKTGGSLLAEADGDTTRFIAVFPGDLAEDPPEVRQTDVSSGIEDLTALQLSML